MVRKKKKTKKVANKAATASDEVLKLRQSTTAEINKIIQSIETNLKNSEQTMQNTLHGTYQYLDEIAERVDNLGDPQSPSLENEGEESLPEYSLDTSNMVTEVQSAQSTFEQSFNHVNDGIQQAAKAYKSAEEVIASQLSHDAPPHLQQAINAVEQSVATTAAALQRSVEQRNLALQQVLEKEDIKLKESEE